MTRSNRAALASSAFNQPGRIAQLLHNQTGLAIKGALAAEPDVAVTSVPFHLAAPESLGGAVAGESPAAPEVR